MGGERRGFWLGATAYGLWGLFPLYWPLLEPAGAVEILAHRMVWSLLVMLALLAVLREWAWIREIVRTPGTLALVALAALMISVNWGTYIYGVNHDQVVETSLGYFITPLVLIGIGVVVLGERLRALQWAAVATGATAVLVLIVAYGRVPWIALTLASSFAVYGYLKKRVALPATRSLTVETAVMFLPALGYLCHLSWTGQATFGHEGTGQALLLAGSGVVTAIPLLMFGVAAGSVPLTTIGLLQYLAPVLQFLIGVTVKGEPMPGSRWAGFALVWLALALLTTDAVRRARAGRGAEKAAARATTARPVATASPDAIAPGIAPGTVPVAVSGAGTGTAPVAETADAAPGSPDSARPLPSAPDTR